MSLARKPNEPYDLYRARRETEKRTMRVRLKGVFTPSLPTNPRKVKNKLDVLLSNRKITQEEYDGCFPGKNKRKRGNGDHGENPEGDRGVPAPDGPSRSLADSPT